MLAFLPWKVIWSLQMKPKEKIGVALAMSMAVLFVLPFYILTIPGLVGLRVVS